MSSISTESIESTDRIPGHNIFQIDNIIFSSLFDNGNLYKIEKINNKYEYRIWTANDNAETIYQSKNNNPWFHFSISGLSQGITIRIYIASTSSSSGLYKHDMRPVYRCKSTNNKWIRIKHSIKILKLENQQTSPQISFDHYVDISNDTIYFAFTYPYSYSELQDDLNQLDIYNKDDNIYINRELLMYSIDKRRIDLLTISSYDNISSNKEPLLPNLFPMTNCTCNSVYQKSNCNNNYPNTCVSTCQSTRPFEFNNKEVVFVSARVHPGEVPAQHTLKGIINLLLDKSDLRAIELRKQYVFKIIPMLNPDGVYRGHFRQDQYGQNLNRYYKSPDISNQPSIYASKSLLDYYSYKSSLTLYLDLHAHSSKRGCFIYGNILDNIENQIQNQLYYPSDMALGLTADGSGRVSTYLNSGIIHSYTLECNYNCNKYNLTETIENSDTSNALSEKFTPLSYENVGIACIITLLDIKNENPSSRISKSKYKSIQKIKLSIYNEIKLRKEFKKQLNSYIYNNQIQFKRIVEKIDNNLNNNIGSQIDSQIENQLDTQVSNHIDYTIDSKKAINFLKNNILTLDYNKDRSNNTSRVSTPIIQKLYIPTIEPNNTSFNFNQTAIPNKNITYKYQSVKITRADNNVSNSEKSVMSHRPLSSGNKHNNRHFSAIGFNFLMGKKVNSLSNQRSNRSMTSRVSVLSTRQITVGDVSSNNITNSNENKVEN